jgi:6-phosphogluconolactonase
MIRCIVLQDAEAVAAETARRITRAASRAQVDRGAFHLALAGGTTPRRAYEILAQATDIDWTRVHISWGDERAVPPDDPRSNQHMARAALLERVPIPRDQIHPLPAWEPDLDAAAQRYEELLRQRLGEPPRLDLALLGLGTDAHSASLFPDGTAVQERERLVVAAPAPVIAARLTLTPVALGAAREVDFVVTGADKAAALRRALHAPYDPLRIPPHAIVACAAEVVWLVDRAAAGDA